MFKRNEKGALTFVPSEFEVMLYDIFDAVEPQNMEELIWMVDAMINTIQRSAWFQADASDYIDEAWKDIYVVRPEAKDIKWGDRVIAQGECDDIPYEGTVIGWSYAGSWDTNVAIVQIDELGHMPYELRFLTKIEEEI